MHQQNESYELNEFIISLPSEDSEAHQALTVLWSLVPTIRLSHIQTVVFVESWKGKTYQQISESVGYDADYLKDVGHRLWKNLSSALEESISKHNFRSIIRQRSQDIRSSLPNSSRQEVIKVPSSTTANLVSDRLEHQPVKDLKETVDLTSFFGRVTEIRELEQWIVHERSRLVGIFGLGGIGKTSLAMRVIREVEPNFDFIIGRSLRNKPDFATLIKSIVKTILGGLSESEFPSRPDDQISFLIDCLSQRRCLIFLDDWLPLLKAHE
ncbi:MAG: NB-ARC domain-containing protein, partial [Thermosynechococcaceae cyanobacterium]